MPNTPTTEAMAVTPRYDIDDDTLEFPTADDLADIERHGRRRRTHVATGAEAPKAPRNRPPRTEHDQAFKCGHCRQFIGAPLMGGRHRNHCPNCLYSKHVDGKMPGDRKSECRSLMEPIGLFSRRNGEEVLIHRCLGCGKHDPNRVAADDNPVLLATIPPIDAIPDSAEDDG